LADKADAGLEVVWWIDCVWFRDDGGIVSFFDRTVSVEWHR